MDIATLTATHCVGHQLIFDMALVCCKERTGFSQFLMSHILTVESLNEATRLATNGSIVTPYTALVVVKLTALLPSANRPNTLQSQKLCVVCISYGVIYVHVVMCLLSLNIYL